VLQLTTGGDQLISLTIEICFHCRHPSANVFASSRQPPRSGKYSPARRSLMKAGFVVDDPPRAIRIDKGPVHPGVHHAVVNHPCDRNAIRGGLELSRRHAVGRECRSKCRPHGLHSLRRPGLETILTDAVQNLMDDRARVAGPVETRPRQAAPRVSPSSISSRRSKKCRCVFQVFGGFGACWSAERDPHPLNPGMERKAASCEHPIQGVPNAQQAGAIAGIESRATALLVHQVPNRR